MLNRGSKIKDCFPQCRRAFCWRLWRWIFERLNINHIHVAKSNSGIQYKKWNSCSETLNAYSTGAQDVRGTQQSLQSGIWQLKSVACSGLSRWSKPGSCWKTQVGYVSANSEDSPGRVSKVCVPVQIDEEAEQVVTQFNHGLLHVRLEQTSVVDLRWVKHSHVPHWNLQVPAGWNRSRWHTRQTLNTSTTVPADRLWPKV